ncbi:YdcF family protein [Candidatus Falkowbacteria bacterium]|nr:YdcF family protein [Candidatus Falkowbacteria bacterium]
MEFPRLPKAPKLTKKDISILTDMIFVEDNIKKSDLIFVFGTSHEEAHKVVLKANKINKDTTIIITGGVYYLASNKKWKEKRYTCHDRIKELLIKKGINPDLIIGHSRSSNTLEDILFAKKIFDFSKVRSILFISKAHHTGRCLRTLIKQLPGVKNFNSYSYNAIYNNQELSRKNWYKTAQGIKRVYGEYLRILEYSKKGDIANYKINRLSKNNIF